MIDVGVLQQSDLPLDQQIRAADVEIVAAAPRQIEILPARAVVAEGETEAYALETVEQRPVHLPGLLGQELMALAPERQRGRHRDQVAILERGPLVVEGVGQLRAGLNIDDQG